MVNKGKYIFLIALLMFMISGCDNKQMNLKEEDTFKTLYAKDFPKDLKSINKFETQEATNFLKNSKPLKNPTGVSFTPVAYNENGLLFGQAVKDNKATFSSFHVNTEAYKELKTLDENTAVGVVCVSDKYVIFKEYYPKLLIVKYYCYNLETNETKFIMEVGDVPSLHFSHGVIKDENIFLFLIAPDETQEKYYYTGYEYDVENNKTEAIANEETNMFPVLLDDYLYYLHIDNTRLVTQLIQYDIASKTKTVIAEGNEKDGYFVDVEVAGSDLLLFVSVNEGKQTNCYKINGKSFEVKPYFYLNYVDSIKGQGRYIDWVGAKRGDDRMRPQFYFMDVKKDIVYNYDESVLNFNKTSVAWVKFLKKENEIEKGEIFHPENSQIMLYQLE